MTSSEIPNSFHKILVPHLPFAAGDDLAATDDLTSLGLDSMGVVALLVDLEQEYDVELPDDILNEATFATVGSLWAAVSKVVDGDVDAA
jgi:acyl carrier protein